MLHVGCLDTTIQIMVNREDFNFNIQFVVNHFCDIIDPFDLYSLIDVHDVKEYES